MEGNVTAEVNFFSYTVDGDSPWIEGSTKPGEISSNFAKLPVRITIHDIRGKESDFNLDKQGFEVHKYDGEMNQEFENDSNVEKAYAEELTLLLKKRLQASRVIVFNHIFRYRGPTLSSDKCNYSHKNPVIYPHVDFDEPSAHAKLKQILSEEEANELMKKRFQIINFWRPIGPNAITKRPLMLCDYGSLDLEKDIHSTNAKGSLVTSTLYTISHNHQGTQKWYYLSNMRSDEILVFKIFDSDPTAVQFCAHTGVCIDEIPEPTAQQTSIETRCFAFYD